MAHLFVVIMLYLISINCLWLLCVDQAFVKAILVEDSLQIIILHKHTVIVFE